MNDTKRMIFAFAISFVILMVWFAFFGPKKTAQVQPAATTVTEQGKTTDTSAPAVAQQAAIALPMTPAPANAATEEKVILKNAKVQVSLTNIGARIDRVTLEAYNDKIGPEGKPLSLMTKSGEGGAFTKLSELGLKTNSMFSVVEKSDTRAVFSFVTPEGVRVEKIFTLNPDRYDLDMSVRIVNGTAAPIKDKLSTYIVGDFTAGSSRYSFRGPAYSHKGSYEQVDVDEVPKAHGLSGDVEWVGVIENYFLWAVVPKDGATSTTLMEYEPDSKTIVRVGVASPAVELMPNQQTTMEYRLFVGPKHRDELAAASPLFGNAQYFGWFTIIAKPLLTLLNVLYGYVGNYGFAIIILTFMIKLLFWPLSSKSYKSMARMKELQPKIDKLKERCGDNKEKLNAEMMQLWKTHKVNPFSGCLPIFVQIPVFIALYNVLMSSIEIRHAPFILYIKDLSAPDPYYITPVLMGASMFLQQKMTPATGMAEAQAKFMLYGMPILFTYLFHDFASGLVLYWLMNNLFSIGQQALMMRGAGVKAKA